MSTQTCESKDMQELRAAFDKDKATLREQYATFTGGEQPRSWYKDLVTEEMRKLCAEMTKKYPRSWFPRGKRGKDK